MPWKYETDFIISAFVQELHSQGGRGNKGTHKNWLRYICGYFKLSWPPRLQSCRSQILFMAGIKKIDGLWKISEAKLFVHSFWCRILELFQNRSRTWMGPKDHSGNSWPLPCVLTPSHLLTPSPASSLVCASGPAFSQHIRYLSLSMGVCMNATKIVASFGKVK